MMMIRPLLAFAALLTLALFYAERGIKSALAPLCAVCTAGLLLAGLGSFGLLPLGGWLVYGLALLALGWLLWRVLAKKKPLPALGYGFWLFVAGGVLLFCVLAARQPMFLTWDEFSTWGTVAKLMKLNNSMYTTAEVGWLWTATQPPFLACLGYLVQFFGPGFAEWQHYFAIDLLLLAGCAALLAPLEKKHWPLAVPLALIGFCTPFVLTLYTQPVKVAPPWLDSLADVPMGFLFGGALVAWYTGKGKGPARFLPSLLALVALTLTKETALALGLVAAALMALDMLAEKRLPGRGLLGHWGQAGLGFAAFLAAVAGPFLLWAGHLSAAADVNRFELGGVRNAGMAEMFGLFFQDLLSPEKSEHFKLITEGMPRLLLTSRSNMLGSGAMAALAALLLVGLAWLLAKQAAQRRRCLTFGVFSLLGFLPYFLLITLTYLYVFRPEQAFESFERYLYPYFIGWFLAAVALLAQTATDARRPALAQAGVLGLSLLLAARVWQVAPPVMTVVGFDASEYNARRRFEQRANDLTARLAPDGKTFIISVDDTGLTWFQYCYAFLPWQVDYSYGGGVFEERELLEDGSRVITPIDVDGWEEHLIENGVTTVFIDKADEAFAAEYGSLFADGMQGYFSEETVVYNVVPEGSGVRLESADILL